MKVFDLFGEIAIKGADTVTAQLDKIENKSALVSKGLKVAGAAFTATGAAGLGLIQSTSKMNASLGTIGVTLGKSAKEMRNLALDTTNVTFPLDSVTKTFDILTRAGIRNTDQLKAAATAFDTLGDATQSSAEQMADLLIPAYKNLGVEIPTTAAELARFTWLQKNTPVEISDFASAMNYVAKEGGDLNITIDEMVAIMAALEKKGLSGTAATMKFRTAVTEAAKGEVIEMGLLPPLDQWTKVNPNLG